MRLWDRTRLDLIWWTSGLDLIWWTSGTKERCCVAARDLCVHAVRPVIQPGPPPPCTCMGTRGAAASWPLARLLQAGLGLRAMHGRLRSAARSPVPTQGRGRDAAGWRRNGMLCAHAVA